MKWLLIILFPLLSLSQTSLINWNKFDPDGTDRHIGAGICIAVVTSEISYQITDNPYKSALFGFIGTNIVGIGKEAIYDGMLHKGTVSASDAVATGWGGLVSTVSMIAYLDWKHKKRLKELDKLNKSKELFG